MSVPPAPPPVDSSGPLAPSPVESSAPSPVESSAPTPVESSAPSPVESSAPPPVELPAPLAPSPVESTPVESPPVDGQFRCPHCGEALYRGEQVCWSCGKRVDVAPELAPSPDVPMTEPVTGGPEPAVAPAALGWDDEPAPDEPPPARPEVMRMAYWSLGLGIASLLTCGGLSILAPISLWLGIKSSREGAGTVGTVGLIMGAIGTLVLLVILAAVVLMVIGISIGGMDAAQALLHGGLLDTIVGGVT